MYEVAHHIADVRLVVTAPSEAPEAYKDIDAVVDVVDRAGIARKIARFRPIGAVKG